MKKYLKYIILICLSIIIFKTLTLNNVQKQIYISQYDDVEDYSTTFIIQKDLNKIKKNYLDAYSTNKETLGWIYMENTMNEPIMYTPDNQNKYLRMDNHLNESPFGVPFMGKYSYGNFDGNTLLYGHRSNYSKSFGPLIQYENQESLNDSPIIICYDGNNDMFCFYRIGFLFELVDGDEFIKQKEFASNTQRKEYNQSLFDRSILTNETIDINYANPMLFLQICKNIDDGFERRVFAASYLGKVSSYE